MKCDVTFANGSVQLAGSLYKPDGHAPYPALIVLHAARGGSREHPFYKHLVQYLPAQGIAVMLYDRRGSGRSTGDFERSDFDDLAGDALAAFAWLHSQNDIDKSKIGVYGISQGGWIAPLVAVRQPDVAFLIVVSGSGVSPAEQMEYAAITALRRAGFSEDVVSRAIDLGKRVNEYYRGNLPFEEVKRAIEKVQEEPWYAYTFLERGDELARDVTQAKWYYEMDHDPLAAWQRVTQPSLFLFGEDDRWVPVRESMARFGRATQHLADVTILQIQGTDHMMADIHDKAENSMSDAYLDALTSWLRGRIGAR